MAVYPAILVFLIFLSACKPYPKDANNTLDSVQNKKLMVGLSAYDSTDNTSHRSVELELRLVEKFAGEVNAKVEWVKGSQSEIVQLLHDNKLHMAIGGYTSPSPFETQVSFTRPYLVKKIRVGATGSEVVPEKIKDREVLVSNHLERLYVEKKGGTAIFSDSLSGGNYLVAGSEEELRKGNARLSDIVLHEEKFVIAVPKGENAFLIRLENFIDGYGAKR